MTQLKSFNSIFSEDSENQKKPNSILDLLLSPSENKEKDIQETILIPIDKLEHFHQHPFQMYPPDKLQELAESIEQHGIYQPVLVRPSQGENGRYEILAGHNRTEAAKLAGKVEIPCRIIDCDEDEAILIVTETNLKQREKLLYSEKAKAYAMQMEALRSQGKRTDLTLYPMGTKSDQDGEYPLGTKFDAAKMVAEISSENRTNIFRYMRLNHLNENLLQLVDLETIPFRAGVELSYLKPQEQESLIELLDQSDYVITIETAAELRKESKEIFLTVPIIEAILDPPKTELKIHGMKPTYKKAFSGVQKQLKNLPVEQLERLEKMDDEFLQKIIMTAIKKCIEAM